MNVYSLGPGGMRADRGAGASGWSSGEYGTGGRASITEGERVAGVRERPAESRFRDRALPFESGGFST
jgi:hypothetical protein